MAEKESNHWYAKTKPDQQKRKQKQTIPKENRKPSDVSRRQGKVIKTYKQYLLRGKFADKLGEEIDNELKNRQKNQTKGKNYRRIRTKRKQIFLDKNNRNSSYTHKEPEKERGRLIKKPEIDDEREREKGVMIR